MLALVAAAIATGTSGTRALAQGLFARREQVIYEGNPVNQATIRLGNWGSGTCKESTQNTYSGSRSIEITPRGLFAGGRIDFANPVDLTNSFNNPDAYLQFVTRFRGVQSEYDDWAVGLGGPGATDMYAGVPRTARPVRRIRVMLEFEGGPAVERQVDVSAFRLSDDGWMNVSLPLAVFKSELSLPEYELKRLVITGDGMDPFHIGEIRTIRDTTPLQANAGQDKEVARNYLIGFQGVCESGATAVKYSWDFDQSDGIQEQAVGDLVYHRFSKAGNFTVTLTVSDLFGLKQPATSTIKVKVNE